MRPCPPPSRQTLFGLPIDCRVLRVHVETAGTAVDPESPHFEQFDQGEFLSAAVGRRFQSSHGLKRTLRRFGTIDSRTHLHALGELPWVMT